MTTLKAIEGKLRGWLARGGYVDPDAVQEGLIVAWRVLEADPDAEEAYVWISAKRGAQAYLRGDKVTGTPRANGHRPARLVPVDVHDKAINFIFEEPQDDEDIDTRLDVERALGYLTPADAIYVWARFWDALPVREAAEVAGIQTSRWSQTIRPRLALMLAER